MLFSFFNAAKTHNLILIMMELYFKISAEKSYKIYFCINVYNSIFKHLSKNIIKYKLAYYIYLCSDHPCKNM